jgi:septal ring factor EnvC (AmiA/AmiB activator)
MAYKGMTIQKLEELEALLQRAINTLSTKTEDDKTGLAGEIAAHNSRLGTVEQKENDTEAEINSLKSRVSYLESKLLSSSSSESSESSSSESSSSSGSSASSSKPKIIGEGL